MELDTLLENNYIEKSNSKNINSENSYLHNNTIIVSKYSNKHINIFFSILFIIIFTAFNMIVHLMF